MAWLQRLLRPWCASGALPEMGAPNKGMATTQLFANLTTSADPPPKALPQPPPLCHAPQPTLSAEQRATYELMRAEAADTLAALGIVRK